MPVIPGHAVQGQVEYRLDYLAAGSPYTDVDVFADLGSPVEPVRLTVFVEAGVEINATDPTGPGMSFLGFDTRTRIRLINEGEILGAGGEGGLGGQAIDPGDSESDFSGGGGGGAGAAVGAGGVGGNAPSTGADGTKLLGGGGGAASTVAITFAQVAPTDGEAGGDAILTPDLELTIENASGFIRGGGGGGGGGGILGTLGGSTLPGNGGDGGGPGVAGARGTLFGGVAVAPGNGGAAGYAIRGSSQVTFDSGGTSPNVEGAVGT